MVAPQFPSRAAAIRLAIASEARRSGSLGQPDKEARRRAANCPTACETSLGLTLLDNSHKRLDFRVRIADERLGLGALGQLVVNDFQQFVFVIRHFLSPLFLLAMDLGDTSPM